LAQGLQRANEVAAAALPDPVDPSTATLAPADAPLRPESKWWSVLAWPYRALKRLVQTILELIG